MSKNHWKMIVLVGLVLILVLLIVLAILPGTEQNLRAEVLVDPNPPGPWERVWGVIQDTVFPLEWRWWLGDPV